METMNVILLCLVAVSMTLSIAAIIVSCKNDSRFDNFLNKWDKDYDDFGVFDDMECECKKDLSTEEFALFGECRKAQMEGGEIETLDERHCRHRYRVTEAIDNAKPNMDKIQDIDRFVDEVKGI